MWDQQLVERIVAERVPHRVKVKGKQYSRNRVVMEHKLGRPLTKSEYVGHVNGDKLDNRPENLYLLSGRYAKTRRYEKQCVEPDCTAAAESRERCGPHYRRLLAKEGPTRPSIGLNQGAGWLDSAGYRRRMHNGRMVMEHRLIKEQELGRPLHRDEIVHHINGVRSDNSLDNLEVWVTSHPAGQRIADVLAHAYEMIKRYG